MRSKLQEAHDYQYRRARLYREKVWGQTVRVGTKCPRVRILGHLADEIRALLESGVPIEEIAADVGCSPETVRRELRDLETVAEPVKTTYEDKMVPGETEDDFRRHYEAHGRLLLNFEPTYWDEK